MDNRGTTNKNYFPTQTSLLRRTETPAAKKVCRKAGGRNNNRLLYS